MHIRLLLLFCLGFSAHIIGMNNGPGKAVPIQIAAVTKTAQSRKAETSSPKTCPDDNCDLCTFGIPFDAAQGRHREIACSLL